MPCEIVSRPYLTVAGATSLRFLETAPPPDLTTRLPAGGPSHLGHASTEPPVTATKPEDLTTPIATASIAAAPSEQPPAPASNDKLPTAGRPILPDDAKPRVKPEDFLPYFQYPGSTSERDDVPASPTPPTPGIQPPSSASYRQQ